MESFALFGSLLSVLFVGMVMLGTFGASYAMVASYRKEWQGTWRGHRILIQNHLNEEHLYIDGRLVARGGNGWAKMEETLTAEVEGQPVMAVIKPTQMMTGVTAELYIGGVAVPLEAGKVDTFQKDVAAVPSTAREPADPRWHAVGRLVAQITERSPEHREVAETARGQVKALLLEIEDLAAAEEAHAVLDTSGAGASGVSALMESREERARQVLHAVQALHLSAMAGVAEPAALQELVARVEVEVDGERARLARAARVAQRG